MQSVVNISPKLQAFARIFRTGITVDSIIRVRSSSWNYEIKSIENQFFCTTKQFRWIRSEWVTLSRIFNPHVRLEIGKLTKSFPNVTVMTKRRVHLPKYTSLLHLGHFGILAERDEELVDRKIVWRKRNSKLALYLHNTIFI